MEGSTVIDKILETAKNSIISLIDDCHVKICNGAITVIFDTMREEIRIAISKQKATESQATESPKGE